MKTPWSKQSIARGWARWALAGWLIATGLLPLLHLVNPTVVAVLNIAAIAAGVLLVLDR